MSIVGTVIFYPEDAARDPEPVAPTITSISQLLYGQAAGTGTNVTQHLLRCNNYTDCDTVTRDNTYVHQPLTKKVSDIMQLISDNIRTRTAIPNNSAAVGFVNSTSIPVWRMLSIGNTIPGSGLADMMIGNYREVIAADYAFTFLNQFANVAISALTKQHRLNPVFDVVQTQYRLAYRILLDDAHPVFHADVNHTVRNQQRGTESASRCLDDDWRVRTPADLRHIFEVDEVQISRERCASACRQPD